MQDKHRYKLNKSALLKKLNDPDPDFQYFIEEYNLLFPDQWHNLSKVEQLKIIQDNFNHSLWSSDQVDKFLKLKEKINASNNFYLQLILVRTDEIEKRNIDILENLTGLIHKLRIDINVLNSHILKKNTTISFNVFCEETGYSKQTVYNSFVYMDKSRSVITLNLPYFKELIWRKSGKSWKCDLYNFEKTMNDLPYEIRLAIKHRKGIIEEKKKLDFAN